jgi:hypothetical protein
MYDFHDVGNDLQNAYYEGYRQAVKDIADRFFDELEYASVYFNMGDGYIYKAVHIEDVYTIRDKILEGVDNGK